MRLGDARGYPISSVATSGLTMRKLSRAHESVVHSMAGVTLGIPATASSTRIKPYTTQGIRPTLVTIHPAVWAR
jgi:hypothetical protein